MGVKSMTGYGRARETHGGLEITVEVRGVNNRYLDCSIRLPKGYLYAEDALRRCVQSAVGRGKVDVYVTVDATEARAETVRVNELLAESYIEAMRRLYEMGNGVVRGKFTATDLARFPDVLMATRVEEDECVITEEFCVVLENALASFNAMRAAEGEKLAADIAGRLAVVTEITARVEARSPQTAEEYREKLLERMREALMGAAVDETRLLTEAAIYADKVAVDEETVRIRSHVSQARDLLAAGGSIGRKLDFLLQELNREANTIGSKCADLQIAREVVDLKATLEKIREQIQNLE